MLKSHLGISTSIPLNIKEDKIDQIILEAEKYELIEIREC